MTLITIIIFLLGCLALWHGAKKMKSGTITIHDFNLERTMPIRGILAMAIIMHHIGQNVPSVYLLKQFAEIGGIVVAMFFFLSGYGLMISYIKKGKVYLDGFLKRRYVKLLPAFLLVMILYQVYLSFGGYSTVLESIKVFAHGETILPDSWFIIVLLLYYLLFYLCARLCKSTRLTMVAMWIATAAYILILHHLEWGEYWYKSIAAINLGITYALYEDRIKQFFTQKPSALLWSIAISVAAVTMLYVGWIMELGSTGLTYFIVPLLMVWIVYVLGMWKNSTLMFLGTISYEIYIAQCVFRHRLYFLSYTHWSLYFVATIITSVLVAYLLNRFSRFILRKSMRQ